jgi:hypothetical protein
VFHIDFTTERSPSFGSGLIVLGDFSEHFSAPLTIWTENEYRRQWRDGLERLVQGTRTSCLVTAIVDPRSTEDNLELWPMWLFGDEVRVHQVVFLPGKSLVRFELADPYAHVEVYESRSTGDFGVSEWRVSLAEVRSFLLTRGDWKR